MTEPPHPPFVPAERASSSPIGTWDEWLLARPTPEPPPGENSTAISAADFVAVYLRLGQAPDFGISMVRKGLRDLFDEFEAATTGQTVLWRDPRP